MMKKPKLVPSRSKIGFRVWFCSDGTIKTGTFLDPEDALKQYQHLVQIAKKAKETVHYDLSVDLARLIGWQKSQMLRNSKNQLFLNCGDEWRRFDYRNTVTLRKILTELAA